MRYLLMISCLTFIAWVTGSAPVRGQWNQAGRFPPIGRSVPRYGFPAGAYPIGSGNYAGMAPLARYTHMSSSPVQAQNPRNYQYAQPYYNTPTYQGIGYGSPWPIAPPRPSYGMPTFGGFPTTP